MHVYKIKFQADDLKYNYLVDVEVLGKNREQAIQMASEEAGKFLCSSRINDIEQLKGRVFFGKPKIVNISENRKIPKN